MNTFSLPLVKTPKTILWHLCFWCLSLNVCLAFVSSAQAAVIIFEDDFEVDLGWIVNPLGTDTATKGLWERADPEPRGDYQLGNTTSGQFSLITGGADVYNNNVKGLTSIRSPDIALPLIVAGESLSLTFSYYFAHTRTSAADYFRITIVGESGSMVVQEEPGTIFKDYPVWDTVEVVIDSFAGETIYLLVEARDEPYADIIEAAVDDVRIEKVGSGAPATPNNTSGPATSDTGSFTFSWGASTDATTYQLERSNDGGSSWSLIQSTAATSYVESGLAGGSYQYRVMACNGVGCSAYTVTHTVLVSIPIIPAVPSAISGPGSSDTGGFTLTWGASTDATTYQLERSNDGGSSWSLIQSTAATSYAESGLADGSYQYRVMACNGVGCSAYTATHTVLVSTPSVPASPVAISGPVTSDTGSFTLIWGASADATTYQLERSNDGSSSWSLIQSNPATSYAESGLTDGSYQYRVMACNELGCSGYSSIHSVLITRVADVPEPPPVSLEPVPSSSITDDTIGTTAGNFRVDESGAATYNIPIASTAGTAGVAPQISLNYSSGGGNGLLGTGWSIGGLSGVTRCRQTLHQDNNPMPVGFNSEDRFCLDGQRLLVVSGSYGEPGSVYKTEIDSFAKITAVGGSAGHPDYFTVVRKDGSTSWYGHSGTSDSEQTAFEVDGSATTNVLTWALKTFADSVGNFIVYTYDNELTGHRITEIRYAYGVNMSWDAHGAHLEFIYADRPDLISGYVAGYGFSTTKRLSTVKSYNGASLLREYKLAYLDSSTNGLSKLEQVQECKGTSCLSPTRFDWAEPDIGFSSTASSSITLSNQSDAAAIAPKTVDINGDGLMDIIWQVADWDSDGQIHDQWWLYALSNGNGFGSQQTAYYNGQNLDFPSAWEVLDYNADGRMDLAIRDGLGSWRVHLSVYSGGQWVLSTSPIALGIWSEKLKFADLQSDGLLDLYSLGDGAGTVVPFVNTRLLEPDPSQALDSNTYYKFGESQQSPPLDEVDVDPETGMVVLVLESFVGNADFNGSGQNDIWVSMYAWVTDAEFSSFANSARIHIFDAVKNEINPYYELTLDDSEITSDAELATFFGTKLNQQPLDFNGDGLPDLIRESEFRLDGSGDYQDLYFQLNTGAGFTPLTRFATLGSGSNFYPYQFADYNQDGHPDLIWHHKGANALKCQLWDPSTNSFEAAIDIRTGVAYNQNHIFLDMNGDGALDYVRLTTDKLHVYKGLNNGETKNQITRITNGLGAETDITYKPLSTSGHYERLDPSSSSVSEFYTDINGPWDLPAGSQTLDKNKPVLELNAPQPVVIRVDSSAPAAGVSPVVDVSAKSAIEYYYGEARIQASGRGYLGFESIRTVDVQTGIETTTSYRQDWPFIGYPLRTEVYSAEGTLLSEADNTWALQNWDDTWPTTALDNGTAALGGLQPYIGSAVERTYDLISGGLLQTVTTDSTYDDYGNPTQITVATTGGGEAFVKDTVNTYGTTVWEKEMGRLSDTTVTSAREGFTDSRTSTFTYYTDGVLKGLLRTETIEPDQPQLTVSTTYSYDAFGNKVRSAVQAGAISRCDIDTIEYDLLGRYADTTWDCLGRLSSNVVARNEYGSPLEVDTYIDSNGLNALTTFYAYSPMGPRYFEANNTGAWSTTTIHSCSYEATTNGCPSGAAYFVEQNVAGGGNSREYFDVLGRSVRARGLSFNGYQAYTDIQYDNLGRAKHRSEPYFAGETTYWTTFDYDILGRLTQTTLPDASLATTDYQGFATIVTNDLGQQRSETVNAVGETVHVMDNLGGELTYLYDSQGNLRETTVLGSASDPHTVVSSMDYDLLGRKISMDDPDKGQWIYQYNSLGELILQSDAKGQSSEMDYDGLGRMKSRLDYRADSSVEGNTSWHYDTAINGLGQLDYVEDLESGYLKSVEYDNLGRISKTLTSLGINGVDGDHYEKVTYDQFGRPFQTFDAARNDDTYTDNGIEHRYNVYGYPHQLVDAVYSGGETRSIYRETLTTDARGNVLDEKLGNNVVSERDYYVQTGRIKSLLSTSLLGTSGDVQDLSYQWDTLGNLSLRDELSGSKNLSENFLYDGLNRLTSYQVAGQTATTVDYDSLGNIKDKSDVGIYTYDGIASGPHALTRIDDAAGGTSYGYDANGNNLSSSDGRLISYSTFDKPLSLEKDGHTTSFAYGPDRARYQRSDTGVFGTTTTLYIGSVEKITKADGSKQVKRHIGGIAIITLQQDSSGATLSSDTHYLMKDHLGSLDVITDASGAIIQELSFDAWGLRRNAGDWLAMATSTAIGEFGVFSDPITTRGFTGHEMVDEVGVIHMNGRIYDPKLGRFLQADPFVQSPTNTQSYNRYSYTLNNPLNATDPSGYLSLKFKDIVKIAAVVVVSVVTYGAVSGWAANLAWTSGLTAQSTMAVAATQSLTFGGIVGSAAAGAVSGAMLTGTFKGAAAGAFSGAVFSGIGAYYGNSWGPSRAASTSLAGGVTSKASGGSFADGMRLSLATSMMRLGWGYTRVITNRLKNLACNNGGVDCKWNRWFELLTDGIRDADTETLGYGRQPISKWTRWFPNMEVEGGGKISGGGQKHLYSEDSWFGRFINKTSKTHDWMNSHLSKSFGLHGYNTQTGFWLSGSQAHNTIFELYSGAGMLPAATFTAGAMSAGLPVQSAYNLYRDE